MTHNHLTHNHRRIGSATLEMTLVGIPIIFILISTFEMARGMWIYHTLSYAVKEGTRYAMVHGVDCSTAPNNCPVTFAQIAGKIRTAAAGLDPDLLSVDMESLTDGSGGMKTLTNLLANNNKFPDPTLTGGNPQNPITFAAQYPFLSAISMFWPGAGRGMSFQNLTCSGAGTLCLPASSQERIQF
jgi:Flp pilus assembly protein TadG